MAKLLKTEIVQVTCNEVVHALRASGLEVPLNATTIKVIIGSTKYTVEPGTKFEFTCVAEPEEMDRDKEG